MPSIDEGYLGTVERLEPAITPLDVSGSLASIAISLKRIADVMETTNAWGEQGSALIARAITEQLRRD